MSSRVDSEALKKDGVLSRPLTDYAQGDDAPAFFTEEALLRLEEALRGGLRGPPFPAPPSQETPPQSRLPQQVAPAQRAEDVVVPGQSPPSTVAPSQETPPPMQPGQCFSELDAARPRARDNGFAFDQERACWQRRNGRHGERERLSEIVVVAGDQPHDYGVPSRHNRKAAVFDLVEQALGKVEKRIADCLTVSTQIEAISQNLPLAPQADQPEIRTEEPVPSPSWRYWRAADLRGLLGRVLNEVEDLHPELREAIERALAS